MTFTTAPPEIAANIGLMGEQRITRKRQENQGTALLWRTGEGLTPKRKGKIKQRSHPSYLPMIGEMEGSNKACRKAKKTAVNLAGEAGIEPACFTWRKVPANQTLLLSRLYSELRGAAASPALRLSRNSLSFSLHSRRGVPVLACAFTSTNRSWAAGVRETYGMSRLTVRKEKPARVELAVREPSGQEVWMTDRNYPVTNCRALQSGSTPMFGRADFA